MSDRKGLVLACSDEGFGQPVDSGGSLWAMSVMIRQYLQICKFAYLRKFAVLQIAQDFKAHAKMSQS